MFNIEESNNLRVFLSRVNLKGEEAEVLVSLMRKIVELTEKPKGEVKK